MGRTIDDAMDELQEGLDFSYIVAEVQGKELTNEQHKAKERTLMHLLKSETPGHEARLREILEETNG